METWAVEASALAVVVLCIVWGWYQGLLLKIYSLIRIILYFTGTVVITIFLLMILPDTMPEREAVAAIASLVITGILLMLVAKALKIVNHIPVVNKLNRIGGAVLGAVYGVILLWILMFVCNLCQNNVSWCKDALQAVAESELLSGLYYQNPLKGLMKF
jgi:uncharacterized membrane protein required for colicin V production